MTSSRCNPRGPECRPPSRTPRDGRCEVPVRLREEDRESSTQSPFSATTARRRQAPRAVAPLRMKKVHSRGGTPRPASGRCRRNRRVPECHPGRPRRSWRRPLLPGPSTDGNTAKSGWSAEIPATGRLRQANSVASAPRAAIGRYSGGKQPASSAVASESSNVMFDEGPPGSRDVGRDGDRGGPAG